MQVQFEISAIFDATPKQIYDAWLDSEKHSAMTGGEAMVSAVEGETFEAWDGYIQGRNIRLEENKKIVQHWRTREFTDSEEDSLLEVILFPKSGGTFLTIRHSRLPAHGMQYKQGWVDSYLNPMVKYFRK